MMMMFHMAALQWQLTMIMIPNSPSGQVWGEEKPYQWDSPGCQPPPSHWLKKVTRPSNGKDLAQKCCWHLSCVRGTACPLLGAHYSLVHSWDIWYMCVHRKVCARAHSGAGVCALGGVGVHTGQATRLHTDLWAGRRRLQQEIAQHQLNLLLLLIAQLNFISDQPRLYWHGMLWEDWPRPHIGSSSLSSSAHFISRVYWQ